jgi:hypothetical protein
VAATLLYLTDHTGSILHAVCRPTEQLLRREGRQESLEFPNRRTQKPSEAYNRVPEPLKRESFRMNSLTRDFRRR